MARTRSDVKQLAELLASCPNPIYLVDDRRRIVYCNEACGRWLGVQLQDLLGSRCDYHAGGFSSDEVAAALCPPPETFLGHEAQGHLVRPGTQGGPKQRLARFLPLGTDSECLGVLAVAGASDQEPVMPESVESVTSAELHRQLQVIARAQAKQYQLDGLVGASPVMRRVREQVRIAVETRARVAIVGPPGSGREHIGRTIHAGHDLDAKAPLMPLSCPVLDAELLQTTVLAFLNRCRELGATSSATILLLDGDQLSAAAQAELLAFFRLPTFEARTVVTARRTLLELASEELFDRELACVLSTLLIELPPLSARREDMPLLAQQMVERVNGRGGKQLSGLSEEVLDRLGAMPFSANLDELAEIIEEACRESTGPWIQVTDLPARVALLQSAAAHPPPRDEAIQMDEFLKEVERELVRRALERAKGNKARAARMLGIQRARLLRRLPQLGLDDAE